MARHSMIAILCALLVLAATPSASRADETSTTTSVTLQGKPERSGCAVWLVPAEPVRFGVLTPPSGPENLPVAQAFSLLVLAGSDETSARCTVTTGGSSFRWNDRDVRSIHAIKLTESATSTVPVLPVPQVNDMTGGELQSILMTTPEQSGCAIVVATLDRNALPTLPTDAIVLGTLTLTLSAAAP